MNSMRFRMNSSDSLKLSDDLSSRRGRVNNDAITVQLPITPGHSASADEVAIELAPTDVDPTAEDAYWAAHFRSRSYVSAGAEYPEFRAAYRFGWESRRLLPDTSWDIAKPKLRAEWTGDPANFQMTWGEAERAVLDAWNHAGAERSS